MALEVVVSVFVWGALGRLRVHSRVRRSVGSACKEGQVRGLWMPPEQEICQSPKFPPQNRHPHRVEHTRFIYPMWLSPLPREQLPPLGMRN